MIRRSRHAFFPHSLGDSIPTLPNTNTSPLQSVSSLCRKPFPQCATLIYSNCFSCINRSRNLAASFSCIASGTQAYIYFPHKWRFNIKVYYVSHTRVRQSSPETQMFPSFLFWCDDMWHGVYQGRSELLFWYLSSTLSDINILQLCLRVVIVNVMTCWLNHMDHWIPAIHRGLYNHRTSL